MRARAHDSPSRDYTASTCHSFKKRKKKVLLSVLSQHKAQPRLISDSDAVRSFSQQSSTLFYVLRHRLPTGAKYGTESELAWMDVAEWKHSSQQETHSASNASVRLARAVLSRIRHWASQLGEPAQSVLLYKHRVLDIPDIPSCDIFFSWDSLMSLPAGVIACAK